MLLTFKNISNKKNNGKYFFTDLHLDFKETQRSINNRDDDVVSGNDLQIDTDEAAIANSIRNILLQRRFLNPSFGANLRKYIGQPLSEMSAKSLGDIIDRNLNIYEPRITVEKIFVAPDYDNFKYGIAIIYKFKNFINNTIILNGFFNVRDGDLYFIK
jgi:phage baseplate assembly protein W